MSRWGPREDYPLRASPLGKTRGKIQKQPSAVGMTSKSEHVHDGSTLSMHLATSQFFLEVRWGTQGDADGDACEHFPSLLRNIKGEMVKPSHRATILNKRKLHKTKSNIPLSPLLIKPFKPQSHSSQSWVRLEQHQNKRKLQKIKSNIPLSPLLINFFKSQSPSSQSWVRLEQHQNKRKL